MLTNPSSKQDYFDHVSRQSKVTLCEYDLSKIRGHEAVLPFAAWVIKGGFEFYTEPAKNYLLFTAYKTHLPGCKVHGIGVAGQFFVWSSYRSN